MSSGDVDAAETARRSRERRERAESRYLSAEAEVFRDFAATATDGSRSGEEERSTTATTATMHASASGAPSPSGSKGSTDSGFHSPLTSPRELTGTPLRRQWSDSGSVGRASNDGGEGTAASASARDETGGLSQSGTLRIKDLDTGKEFIMRKSEASALLSAHHANRKIVEDASTGSALTVNEFGNEAGLESSAPEVPVHARGEKWLNGLRHIQTLRAQEGAVWTLKFNHGGEYLATAGQDRVIRVWKTLAPSKHRGEQLFEPTPMRAYVGHRGDILDLCWSHTDWLLSSSMDKTVRLWYTTMAECLRIFTHQDFVTSIQFNPRNDKFFISGSLDGKLRMWNIPDLKVVDWVDIGEMVTSCAYSPEGESVVVGTHKGNCHYYGTENFKFEYQRQLQVKNARGRKGVGRKITGIEFMPGDSKKLLVTANDSRIRLYDDRSALSCKYKGHLNQNAQIKATFSPDGEFILSGSEQPDVFLWKTEPKESQSCACASGPTPKQHSHEKVALKERHVTSAVFAPEKLRASRAFPLEELNSSSLGLIIVSAGYSGRIEVFENCSAPARKD